VWYSYKGWFNIPYEAETLSTKGEISKYEKIEYNQTGQKNASTNNAEKVKFRIQELINHVRLS